MKKTYTNEKKKGIKQKEKIQKKKKNEGRETPLCIIGSSKKLRITI